jgi:hypothetical protein
VTELTTGLTTLDALDDAPVHFRVTWIAWDSPFHATELQVGDRIIAVDGVSVSRPDDPRERARIVQHFIGQGAEPQQWSARQLAAGAPLTLRVRRRTSPRGWTELEVTAPLAEKVGYRNADNRIVLGPDGPDTMARDEFSESWGSWYEQRMVPMLSHALDVDRHTGTFVTRAEWKRLGEHERRVVFAAERYPGPWSSALTRDYQAARAICQGEALVLAAGALDFRRRGQELAAEVRAKATAAWKSVQEKSASETISPFPAINPVRGDPAPVVGKLVVLPPLGNAQWVNEAGHGWFTAGSAADGWYFIDAQGEPAQAMLLARRRYTKLVDPALDASFEFLARITADARLVCIGDRTQFGLVADPLAALVGGSMFVDLVARVGTQAAFAGEEAFLAIDPALPARDATPAEVLAAVIDAIKLGDLPLWRALHADWAIEWTPGGRQRIQPHALPPNESHFEDSRRSLASRVQDVRVAWVDDSVVVADGKRFPGALHIEEVTAWLDHFGDVGGVTRWFSDTTVRREWRLQRVDRGPWRVATAQPI